MKRKIIAGICVLLASGGIFLYVSPRETVEEPPTAEAAAEQPETLDDCLIFMQYLSFGVGNELDAMLEENLLTVDKLLQNGARPTDNTKNLLPMDDRLRGRVTDILEKHGIHIMAGDNPDNPCCVPL